MRKLITSIHRFVMGLKRPSKQTNTRLLHERGETLSSFIIRKARVDDIPALAALHVKTWSETYWTTPSPPTYQVRETQWKQQFMLTNDSWFCFIVENMNGQLIGFAKGKLYAHNDLPEFSSQLDKIYLLRKYQRLGIGRKLVGHVAREFLSQGITNMVLFGTAENPSCGFHEALGGERLYGGKGEFHGGYCWRDLKKLADSCPIN